METTANQAHFYAGLFISGIFLFLSQLLIDHLTTKREQRNRDEMFKMKIFEMRLAAAQTTYQWLFKVEKANTLNTKENQSPFDQIHLNSTINKFTELLDGYALILGEDIYKKASNYLYSVAKKKDEKTILIELNLALNSLEKIVTNKQIKKFTEN